MYIYPLIDCLLCIFISDLGGFWAIYDGFMHFCGYLCILGEYVCVVLNMYSNCVNCSKCMNNYNYPSPFYWTGWGFMHIVVYL